MSYVNFNTGIDQVYTEFNKIFALPRFTACIPEYKTMLVEMRECATLYDAYSVLKQIQQLRDSFPKNVDNSSENKNRNLKNNSGYDKQNFVPQPNFQNNTQNFPVNNNFSSSKVNISQQRQYRLTQNNNQQNQYLNGDQTMRTVKPNNFGNNNQDFEKEHPTFYASGTLNVHERNYSPIEKELLAIVWDTKYFRPYLYGIKFEIKTDHRPLVWLQSLKDPDSKTLRWRIKLNEYNFNISYVKGKENQVADFLSRSNTDQNEINYQNKIPSDIATIHSGKEELNDHIHIREGRVNTCKHQIILAKEKQKELQTVHKNRHIYIDEIDLNSENLTTEILKRNLPEKGKI
ncbi:unnamed protein product [Hermetia illucens]|uniref:Reverse transcriptase RNase H-like domain-containing protein n=1 Tax=Hermetia illucens TaxID=343691 RepID=A0A7R8UD51_HERIL|nr:unnamed protein product [Hermetia illucens]